MTDSRHIHLQTELLDYERLIAEVMERNTHPGSSLHGEPHWQRVAWTGLHLAPEVPGCDPRIVFLFALFHDSQRQNDDWDPEHGARAALLASFMHGEHFRLEPERLDLLRYACHHHAHGRISDDPTVGVCWDADRLNLWRVGMRPDPKYLSTEAARRPGRIEWARWIQGEELEWCTIHSAYEERFGW
jgi:uncharacterized protein